MYTNHVLCGSHPNSSPTAESKRASLLANIDITRQEFGIYEMIKSGVELCILTYVYAVALDVNIIQL